MAGRTRDEWAALLEHAEACVAPILDLGEALAHPMARARGMVQDGLLEAGSDETAPTLGTPIRFDGQVTPVGTPPPTLGADTVALAEEAGLDGRRDRPPRRRRCHRPGVAAGAA